jgi:hypothetical protein
MILIGAIAQIDWKSGAELLAATVGLATLLKGTMEYLKQGTQKRADLFLQMRERFHSFRDICVLLDHKNEERPSDELRQLPFERKRAFIGFFEEIALMTKSGLIKPDVAHYMFGYYAIRCWESDSFWNPGGPNRQASYWRVFFAFVTKMKQEEQRFAGRKFSVNKYRL